MKFEMPVHKYMPGTTQIYVINRFYKLIFFIKTIRQWSIVAKKNSIAAADGSERDSIRRLSLSLSLGLALSLNEYKQIKWVLVLSSSACALCDCMNVIYTLDYE